jgi:alpha-galactosidase
MKRIKIAYLGGGSKEWAHVFMNDLAFSDLNGEIALYDIDLEAAKLNQKIGCLINKDAKTKSVWDYKVYEDLDHCLIGADFVAISILPGTFKEMHFDVHAPEEYGIYQPVGDTTGPGGVLRSMRTVPIYMEFAEKIKANCPDAWVLNFTNPMSICLQTLYDVFPKIKAFGCCHEVFNTQNFLCEVLREETGIKATREEIFTDVFGINHFTWINKAYYRDLDLLKLLDSFILTYGKEGYNERGEVNSFRTNPFHYANLVKMDFYRRYGILGAAGDRHLVEFMNPNYYLKDKEMIDAWKFALTTVDFRILKREKRLQELKLKSEGKLPLNVEKSNEEAIALIRSILGYETKVSNVNLPNYGQMPNIPKGAIVETNAVFSTNSVRPIIGEELNEEVNNLVLTHVNNQELLYQGIKNRDLEKIFMAFLHQPLCVNLKFEEAQTLFKTMIKGTRTYLDHYFDLDSYLN